MSVQQFRWHDDLYEYPPLPSLLIAYPKKPHRNHAHKRDHNNNEGNNNYNLGSRFNDLCDTLLELIFTRLVQWRHLATCKCVSKRWNSIISNPYFTRCLTNKHTPFTLILRNECTDNCLITEHPYFQTHNLRLDFINANRIVASHNDILVLCRVPSGYEFLRVELAYYIANPLTKQFIVVPVTCGNVPPYNYSFESWAVGFAGVVSGVSTIDVPNSKNNVKGFRIIRINTQYPNMLIIQIYSSEYGKWETFIFHNKLGFVLRSQDIFDGRNQAVTFNNRVHWRGQDNKILVIDPFVKLYSVLSLPDEIHEKSVLGSYRNQLRISQFDYYAPRIKIWEFEDYDDLYKILGFDDSDDLIIAMAKLRLVTDFTLKPCLIDSVFPTIEGLEYYHLRNELICCHPNDPDTVYILYRDTLLECDVMNSRLKVIRYCTTTWTERFILMAP